MIDKELVESLRNVHWDNPSDPELANAAADRIKLLGKVLFNLCGSLSLSDNTGDVIEDIVEALRQVGQSFEPEDYTMPELMEFLHGLGATTLHGTSIGPE